ncbi:MAG TPA: hypothetical protein DCG53_00390 [Syntrophus sp. (in: bacteria)]|nr:hypothetical protein [Syntrophus sp. (in: bacteria)]
MQEPSRTNQELIEDISVLKQKIQELEKSESERKQVEDALRETVSRAKGMLRALPDMMFRMNNKGIFLDYKADITDLYAQSEPSPIGKRNRDITPPEFADLIDSQIRTALETGTLQTFEYQLAIPGRGLRDYEARMVATGEDEVMAIVRDITDRRRAEEELLRMNILLDSIVENIPDMIFLKDARELRFVRFNQAGEELLGHLRDHILGKNDYDFFPKEQADFFTEKDREVLLRKNIVDIPEEPIQTRNKGERILHTKKVPILNMNGEPEYLLGISEDITERKRAEEALNKAEREKSAILDAMSELIIYLNKDLRIIWANRAMGRQFNMNPNQLEGRHCYEVMHNLDEHCKICPVVKAVETGEPFTIDDFSSYGKRWTLRAYPVRNKEEEVIGFVEIVTDITEHKLAEEERKESERALSDIIDFLPDATLVIDKEEKVIAWNRAIESMTGVKAEAMLGKGNYEYSLPFYGDRRPILIDFALHPDKVREKRYTAIQRVGDILFGESFTPKLPPGDIHLSATASVLRNSKGDIIAAIECIRDNTERKRLEERLNRAEKMEGLGRLAGGVAHDLNNVLGVLVGYSDLLLRKLSEDSSLRRYAENIQQSSMRAAAIIQDLLTLARRGVNISKVVDLNRVIFDYLKTPEFENLKSYSPNVKVCTKLEEGLLNIKGSPIHLGKTIMNLISNALEATSEQGEVMIRTENRHLDQPIRGYDDMQEGDYVVLTVSDSGRGIPTQDLGKIFEPFYTKKVMGRSGTGLGLAVVWGTVKDHNGYIDVQSEEGKGTIFKLYFPVTREELSQAKETVSQSIYMGRGESILVVDDVKEQRELAVNMLGWLGYQVEALSSGEEAIIYLKNNKADLVVLDMIMDPGIDGLETYRRIKEFKPKQKAIVVSGFSETDRVKMAQEIGAGSFVRKPYILEKIGVVVRRELDRK